MFFAHSEFLLAAEKKYQRGNEDTEEQKFGDTVD